jgi:ribose transport system substrate-binding protein
MNRRNSYFLLLASSLLILLGFPGCDRSSAPAGRPTSGYVIGVVPKGATHVFWKSIHAGALKAASELGNVEILWKSGLKEDDRDSQIKVVEDMVTRRVSGIVLAPLDDVALRPVVVEAARNRIPVAIVDSDLKTDQYVSFIATDNYQGGVEAGERLAELLHGKGRVAMLRYAEGSASTMRREQGFLDALKKFPGLELVSSNQYGGATTETAYKASENLLAPFRKPDGSLGLDGIFACNESTTFGMLRALQDGGWAGKVTYVGFDSSEMLINALKRREIQGLVLQDPFNMGYLGVKSVVASLTGQKVERRIDTGSRVATPENMNDPDVHRLLEPEIKKWLKE